MWLLNVVKIVLKDHKCWEYFFIKSQTFVLLIRICQFKYTAVNHGWLKWERTKVYCRTSRFVRDHFSLWRFSFSSLIGPEFSNRKVASDCVGWCAGVQKIILDNFRTKHELKMSNEKNENLQNVSFINYSSIWLINMTHKA